MAKARATRQTLDSFTAKSINKTIKAGDCVLMRPTDSSKRSYVARVEKIESDIKGANVKVHVRWYYRPEESIGGRRQFHGCKEVFLSDHYDVQSVDTIEGKVVPEERRAMASKGRMIGANEIEKLSVDQIKAIKEQTDLEVNLLQDSLNNIRTATARLENASNALHDLSLRPQGKKMLVPLTASLYVPGTLDDADKVLVDVGTGYFIEKTMTEGNDYCGRKINLLKSNYDQLLEVATKKKSLADETGMILQAKLKQLAPAQ